MNPILVAWPSAHGSSNSISSASQWPAAAVDACLRKIFLIVIGFVSSILSLVSEKWGLFFEFVVSEGGTVMLTYFRFASHVTISALRSVQSIKGDLMKVYRLR